MNTHSEKLPCFFADAMLGKLARWMRTLGYDVAYERAISDAELVERALKEDRLVLTRDTLLVKRRLMRARTLFIESDSVGEQLRQVLRAYPPPPGFIKGGFLARCLRCNEPLVSVEKEAVKDEVPEYVFNTQKIFTKCHRCGRIYWPGTHRDRMIDDLKRLALANDGTVNIK